jgi:hypothetical protein
VPGFAEFVWVWYRDQGMGTPVLHLRLADWLEARWREGSGQWLLMAFRGAGKSTLVGLFCAWLLGTDAALRILVLAAEQGLAVKMVRNVKRIVEKHPFLAHLIPAQRDQWSSDRFTVARRRELRDPSVLARGVTGNVTGARADVVICDDVEVPNTCETAEKRAELRRRLMEIDYVLVPGGVQLYVGTPHTYYTIYAETARREAAEERPFLDGFARLEVPVLDTEGRPAWPQKFPLSRVEAIRRRSGPNKFASQMMLTPVAISEGRLDPERLVPYAAELDYKEGNREAVLSLMGRRLVAACCWWDPAYGAPSGGDGSVIAAVFLDNEGRYYLHAIAYLTHDPARRDEVDEATQLCRQAAAFAARHHMPAITLETNGLGRFLPGLLRRELAQSEVSCAVREVANRRPKAERILDAFDAPLAAGALWAHEDVWSTPFIREMREWRPETSGGRDDGLDAVAGCLAMEPVRLPRFSPPVGRPRWRPGTGGVAAPHDFEV